MKVRSSIPLVEEILAEYRNIIGEDLTAYKHHVYRVIHFCLHLKPDSDEEQEEKIIIAACFHDLGIWTNNTFDYLEPSIVLANEYLKQRDREEWSVEVELMIDNHHKIGEYADNELPLVEVFRKADLIDVSLGIVRMGLPRSFVKQTKAAFPNAGFHKRLIQLTGKQMLKNPFKPLPVVRW